MSGENIPTRPTKNKFSRATKKKFLDSHVIYLKLMVFSMTWNFFFQLNYFDKTTRTSKSSFVEINQNIKIGFLNSPEHFFDTCHSY